MRIEILVNNDDPLVYPINKPKLIIGSHEACDIVLNTENVSRKHVVVVTEDDNYYVVDQGSTNGTFLNEERLVPGRRVQFTSFFPVRLGTDVLITLLSDEERPEDQEKISIPIPVPKPRKTTSTSDQTRHISLKDMQKASTESLVKKKADTKKGAVKKPGKKKTLEQNRYTIVKAIAILLIGFATYYNIYVKEKVVPEKVEKISIIEEKPVSTKPVVVEHSVVPDGELTSKESLTNMLEDIKCATDIEKYLCDNIPGANLGLYGSVQVGTMVNTVIDGSKFYEEAKLKLKAGEGEAYLKDLARVAAFLFLKEAVPATFDYATVKDLKLTFALFRDIPDSLQKELIVVIATTPEKLDGFKKLPLPEILKNVDLVGVSALSGVVNDFIRVY